MSRSTALAILVALGLLAFFGVITFNAGDFNDFFNSVRGMLK